MENKEKQPVNVDPGKVVVGLDIGTTKIVCIAGYMNENGKLEILGMGQSRSIGVHRGMVNNIQQTMESIKTAVSLAEKECGIEIKDVHVGIACQHIQTSTNRASKILDPNKDFITEEDVKSFIDDMYKLNVEEGWRIINVIPQEYSVDTLQNIENPVGYRGSRLEAEFHIVQAHVSAIHNIVKSVELAGLNVVALDLEPLASSESVLSEDEKEAGVVLVDIGGGTTDVAIFYKGILRHTAVIPFGGNIITSDIHQELNILERDAENLKIKFGSAIYTKEMEDYTISIAGIRGRQPKQIQFSTLSAIIRARLEEIFDFVQYEIEISRYKERLGAGAVLTGGGSLMKNIKHLFELNTGLAVRLGLPNEYLTMNAPEVLNSPIYATSVGLVLRGLQKLEKTKKIEDTNTEHHADIKNEKIQIPKQDVVISADQDITESENDFSEKDDTQNNNENENQTGEVKNLNEETTKTQKSFIQRFLDLLMD
ncbi:MAG: cell division protein FtsA [Vicingaceae bacterium]|nr:MAG: cell division protein FtsA [Vicingaceae bacterium]